MMVFPIIGLASAVLTAIGGYGLYWYHSMSQAEQAEADRLAMQYAEELYEKSLNELTAHQLQHVMKLVKGDLGQ